MKKILSISFLAAFLTLGIGAGAASAHSGNSTNQFAVRAASVRPVAQRWGQRWDRQPRTRYVTRTMRDGWRLYRVTYRITSFRGRTQSTIVSRVRIR
jgi:hypothetical protein